MAATRRNVTSTRRQPPVCGYTWDDLECEERGEHWCAPRAVKVIGFFRDILVHTKGRWARKPFRLEQWQADDIVSPLFGTVRWDADLKLYVRRYTIAFIEISRKNGKALDVDTPILAGHGWTTMGELLPGDRVHAADGSLVRVQWVSSRHTRPSYRVSFADGAQITAADDHKWLVNDRRAGCARVATTAEIAETLHYGGRGDRRYTVDVPDPVRRPDVSLPIDPYVLGAWLGDGTASRGEITTPDPEVIDAFTAAGYEPTYAYRNSAAVTRGFRGLMVPLRTLGVLNNKHIPDAYLTASEEQRMSLLRGLMDADGCAMIGPRVPRVEFCTTTRALADGVLILARSLGFKVTSRESRAMLNGRDCGPRWRLCWTAWRDRSPFGLARKTNRLNSHPGKATRSRTNAIVAVEPVGQREVVCIAVDHPSHVFLAGQSFTPTHNSELLAGIALYLLVADDEEGAEIYGCALDRDQAGKVFLVAERMVLLSAVLRKRLKIYKQAKRIIDEHTGSFYEIVPADHEGNLGHDPHGIVFDELEVQKDDSLWTAMRTAMGSRTQPLMVAAGTAGDAGHNFGADQHAEAERVAEDPERAPHTFTYLRNTPKDADPWDEANWYHANPALGSFLSLQALREEAVEARNDPAKEHSFRQYRLNQWQTGAHRWMPMHLWQASCGNMWLNPVDGRRELAGRVAYGGLDLAAKFDLTAWCLILPGDDDESPVDVLWRFWLPENGVVKLDRYHDGLFSRWAQQGWITVTDGDVVDYDRVTDDIADDGDHFVVAAVDADEWSMWPVINRIALGCGLDSRSGAVTAYRNTFDRMSPGLDDVMALVRSERFHHHGNPVARFCFDACQVKAAPFDANLHRPDKPDRSAARERIDAVATAAMAANAWRAALDNGKLTSAYEDHGLVIA